MTETLNAAESMAGPRMVDKLIAAIFDSESQARRGLQALDELHAEASITLHASALITKDASGNATVKQTAERGPVGTGVGLVTGSLIGMLGGPVGAAVGACAGSLGGVLYDLARAGVEADFLDQVKRDLQPGKAAVIAEVSEGRVTPLDNRMHALGGVVFRCLRREFAKDESVAVKAEITRLKIERDRAVGEAKAELQAEIDAARTKLRARSEHLEEKIAALQREGDVKISALQREVAVTEGETKVRAEKRLARSRAHYRAQVDKLREARQSVKEAMEICDGSRNPLI
jgi:uncharacterized membrane protein